MDVESVLYEHRGLKMAAKRYRSRSARPSQDDGLTLFFAHGIGLIKEQWVPTIENIFASANQRFSIREAWALDWQNHGESAVYNKDDLKSRSTSINVRTWGEAIAEFARSQHVEGHRIISIGHSAGASAMMHSTLGMADEDSIKYHAMIMIEPPIIEPETLIANDEEHTAIIEFLSQAISARRNTWPSRSGALEYLRKRLPWSVWDLSTLKLFVDHGLQEALDKDGKECVTLKCPREQEAAMYREYLVNFDGINVLDRVLHLIPVYAIFGEWAPPSPEFVHASALKMCELRNIPSTHLTGVNHLIPQENPGLLANALADILSRISALESKYRVLSKL